MKRLMLLAAIGAGLAMAGCDEPAAVQQTETAPPPMDVPPAPAATDATAAVDATGAATDAGPSASTLPADQRASEDTVKPESETLFY